MPVTAPFFKISSSHLLSFTINDFFPSYTTDENSVSASESIAFAQLAISLGVRGVTVVAASGDDGANSVYARGSFVSHCTLLL